MESKKIRKPTHANSWYSGVEATLSGELEKALAEGNACKMTEGLAKGVIVPHAGYRFSLPTAACAFASINPDLYTRIILIGPSHHAYFQGCGLPTCMVYRTPLGEIEIDEEVVTELGKVKGFTQLEQGVEEEEHSLEMQLPLIKKVFGARAIKLVPIMAGDVGELLYPSISFALSRFVADKESLFVISSDFCHWGLRYKYMHYDKTKGEIYQSIEDLDRMGMQLIEGHNPEGFIEYLAKYKNTICGRIPILLYLFAIAQAKDSGLKTKFVKYAQSNKVVTMKDFSVSYAAAVSYKT